jgi:RNA polymerase sigma factor (sigma-70 family)
MSTGLKRQAVPDFPAAFAGNDAPRAATRPAALRANVPRGADASRRTYMPPKTGTAMTNPLPPEPDDNAAEGSAAGPAPIQDWTGTVDRIRAGDPLAMAELYTVFTRGIRYLLLRSLGTEEVDDRVHDCFLIVAEAIRSGELRDPARLMGYVRTVVRRHIAAHIEDAVHRRRTTVEFEDTVFSVSDWKSNPEQSLLARQRTEIARRVFRGVSGRDREILCRFYLLEQPQELICQEMGLSYNQFRLLKSRAKARFGKLGQSLADSGMPGQNPPGKKSEKKTGTDH